MKDYKAYVPYIDISTDIVSEFNLKETENIKLYNISEDKGINSLHYHYAELVAAYYVWKNQLKSDYVCLWNHRRFLTPIKFDELDKDKVQVYYHVYTELTPYEYMIKDGINEYLIYQFIKYMIEKKNIDRSVLIDKIFNKIWGNNLWFHVCFNCNWKVFNDICEFVFGFLEYVIPNGKYEHKESCDLFLKELQTSFCASEKMYKDDQLFTNNGRIKSGDRSFGAIYEMFLPLYCDLIWNGTFSEFDSMKIGVHIEEYNKQTIKDELRRWISKNIFSGCRDFYIKTTEKNYEDLKDFIYSDWYYIYHRQVTVCTKFSNDTIELKLNEYVDVEDPTKNSNYEIKRF